MPIVIVFAYGFIALLSVCISGFLSYRGLLSTAHEITLPLVVFIMGIVLTMDYAISYFRSKSKSIVLPVIIFFVAAFFSMASNFNYLYTNFMRESVTHDTVSRELSSFRDDLVSTRSTILDMESLRQAEDRHTQLRLEIDNVRKQMFDTLRPGCGDRCREHMANVERLAGSTLTDMAIPAIGSDREVLLEWFTRFSEDAEETFRASLEATPVPALNALAGDIEQTLFDFENAEAVVERHDGLNALEDMKTISSDYERRANALLPEVMEVDHVSIDPTIGRLGEIAYSFENGFVERPNLMATVLSLFLASIVDLLPFVMSFALFGPGRLDRQVTVAGSRGRRGSTVIASGNVRNSRRR